MEILVVDRTTESQKGYADRLANLGTKELEAYDFRVKLASHQDYEKRLADADVLMIGSGLEQEIASLIQTTTRQYPWVQIVCFTKDENRSARFLRTAYVGGARKVFSDRCANLDILQELIAIDADHRRQGRAYDGKLVVVVSPKGGSGATSAVSALGEICCLSEKRVLLWDLDVETYDLCRALMMRGDQSDVFNDWIEDIECLTRSALRDTILPLGSHADLLMPPKGMDAATKLMCSTQGVPLAQRIVDLSRVMYDSIIVDTGGISGPATGALMHLADTVLLVVGGSAQESVAIDNYLSYISQLVPRKDKVALLPMQSDLAAYTASNGSIKRQKRVLDAARHLTPIPSDPAASKWAGSGSTFYSAAREATCVAFDTAALQLGIVNSNQVVMLAQKRRNSYHALEKLGGGLVEQWRSVKQRCSSFRFDIRNGNQPKLLLTDAPPNGSHGPTVPELEHTKRREARARKREQQAKERREHRQRKREKREQERAEKQARVKREARRWDEQRHEQREGKQVEKKVTLKRVEPESQPTVSDPLPRHVTEANAESEVLSEELKEQQRQEAERAKKVVAEQKAKAEVERLAQEEARQKAIAEAKQAAEEEAKTRAAQKLEEARLKTERLAAKRAEREARKEERRAKAEEARKEAAELRAKAQEMKAAERDQKRQARAEEKKLSSERAKQVAKQRAEEAMVKAAEASAQKAERDAKREEQRAKAAEAKREAARIRAELHREKMAERELARKARKEEQERVAEAAKQRSLERVARKDQVKRERALKRESALKIREEAKAKALMEKEVRKELLVEEREKARRAKEERARVLAEERKVKREMAKQEVLARKEERDNLRREEAERKREQHEMRQKERAELKRLRESKRQERKDELQKERLKAKTIALQEKQRQRKKREQERAQAKELAQEAALERKKLKAQKQAEARAERAKARRLKEERIAKLLEKKEERRRIRLEQKERKKEAAERKRAEKHKQRQEFRERKLSERSLREQAKQQLEIDRRAQREKDAENELKRKAEAREKVIAEERKRARDAAEQSSKELAEFQAKLKAERKLAEEARELAERKALKKLEAERQIRIEETQELRARIERLETEIERERKRKVEVVNLESESTRLAVPGHDSVEGRSDEEVVVGEATLETGSPIHSHSVHLEAPFVARSQSERFPYSDWPVTNGSVVKASATTKGADEVLVERSSLELVNGAKNGAARSMASNGNGVKALTNGTSKPLPDLEGRLVVNLTQERTLRDLLQELNQFHEGFATQAERSVRSARRAERVELQRQVTEARNILSSSERALSLLVRQPDLPRIVRDGVLAEFERISERALKWSDSELFGKLSLSTAEARAFLACKEEETFERESDYLAPIRAFELSHQGVLDPQIFFSEYSALSVETQRALYLLLTRSTIEERDFAVDSILNSPDCGHPCLTRALEYCVLGGANGEYVIPMIGEVCNLDPQTLEMFEKLLIYPYVRKEIRQVTAEVLVSLNKHRAAGCFQSIVEDHETSSQSQVEVALHGLRVLGSAGSNAGEALVKLLADLDEEQGDPKASTLEIVSTLALIADGEFLDTFRSLFRVLNDLADYDSLIPVVFYLGRYGDSSAVRLLNKIKGERYSSHLKDQAYLAKEEIRIRDRQSPGALEVD